jgi:septum site-determining protein MinC
MGNQDVIFKGTKDGVIVKINKPGNFESIKEAIESQLHKSVDFFKSGKMYIDFCEADMEPNQEEELKHVVLKDYGICIHSVDRNRNKIFKGINEGRTKFVSNTVRSGQSIEYNGNIVIIGDVNAGGQVKADGNIVVLGTLRGVVHAGVSGNKEAIIAAFSLQPIQLRIANVISRPPDGEDVKPSCPELARIKDEHIIIEPYAPNKFI